MTEEEFVAVVTSALKGDHNDLRREQMILRAHREVISALVRERDEANGWVVDGKRMSPAEMHAALTSLRRDVMAAIKSEYLHDATGDQADVAYQQAIDDVLSAVEKVLSSPGDAEDSANG